MYLASKHLWLTYNRLIIHSWKQTMTDAYRRRVLQMLGSTGILLAGGAGTVTAQEKEGASGEYTLVDVAVSADGFNVLVAAVEESELVEALSGDRQLTVFAPTDEAFNEAGITVDNVGDLDVDFLLNVLTYQVFTGRRYAESVVRATRIPTLNGQSIGVDWTELNDGEASIVTTDIEASTESST